MIVVIEGPDGSGKTTLINKLNDAGIKTMPRIPREIAHNDELFGMYAVACRDDICCLDRCFITEWIYRCLKLDERPTVSLTNMAYCMETPRVKFVFCKNEFAFDKAMKRGETYVTTKTEHDLISSYYDFVYNTMKLFTSADIKSYDYDKDNFDELLNWIKGN